MRSFIIISILSCALSVAGMAHAQTATPPVLPTGIGLGAPGAPDGSSPASYENAVPEPIAVQGDVAIYEPAILIDKQQPDRKFLSLVVENRGNRLQRLTASKIDKVSNVAPVVAVWLEDDVQLIPIDQIAINARETVSIGPDSLALRLEGAPTNLAEGQKMAIRLSFEPAGTVQFSATVNIIDAAMIDGSSVPNMEGMGRAE